MVGPASLSQVFCRVRPGGELPSWPALRHRAGLPRLPDTSAAARRRKGLVSSLRLKMDEAMQWCTGRVRVNPDPVLLARCVSNFPLPKATRWCCCSGRKYLHTGSRGHPHNGSNLRIRPQTTQAPQLSVYPFIIAQKSTSISNHGPGVLGGPFSISSIHSIA